MTTTTLGMVECMLWREGRLRTWGTSKMVRERSKLSLTVTNRSSSITTKACQTTLRSGPDGQSNSPMAEGRMRERSPTAPCQLQARNCVNVSSGQQRMPPFCSSPAREPTENLQLSGGKPRYRNAHRARLKHSPAWYLGSWNVQSLVDCEGPVETGGLI